MVLLTPVISYYQVRFLFFVEKKKNHGLELSAPVFLLAQNWPANSVKVFFEQQIASCFHEAAKVRTVS